MKEFLCAASLVSAMALVVSGCSALSSNEPVSTMPEDAQVVEVCPAAGAEAWGDSVPLEEVTDEFGTYCRTTLNPDSPALLYSSEDVDFTSLEEFGFTEQEVIDLMPQTAKFFSEEVIDSRILDNPTPGAFEIWLEEQDSVVFAPNFEPDFETSIVYRNVVPTMVRDGGARFVSSDISFRGAAAVEDDFGNPTLVIYYLATVDYRVSDDYALDYTAENNPDGLSRVELAEQFPHYTDGEENIIRLSVAHGVGFLKDGTVTGMVFDYEPSSEAFPLQG